MIEQLLSLSIKIFPHLKAFAAYKNSTTTIGVEVFKQLQTNNTAYVKGISPVTDTVYSNLYPSGISFYITQQLAKNKLNFFARVDLYNPDSKFNSDNNYIRGYNTNTETFSTIGLDFIPYKNVHIMPNLWHDHFHNKITGASGNLKNDYDLEGRITMYFLFNK